MMDFGIFYELQSAAPWTPKDASDDEIFEHPFVIVGDPDQCARKVEEFKNLGIDQLITFQQCRAIPHDRIMGSIKLFGEEVMPAFRD